MRQISLEQYLVPIKGPEGATEFPFSVRDSLIEILFNRELKLNSVQLLQQNELANKILHSPDDLLLEEEEYERVMQALLVVTGLGRNEVEFVRRVSQAPQVDVAPKPTAP